jgi:hypothetical protein
MLNTRKPSRDPDQTFNRSFIWLYLVPRKSLFLYELIFYAKPFKMANSDIKDFNRFTFIIKASLKII